MIDHDNLEEFQDPVNYDLEEAEGSAARIAYYCRMADRIGGPVLEIACGSGLVALPVAARGHAVTGVDLARPMLNYAAAKAHEKGVPIRLVESDARGMELGTQYRFIYITGNAFQAFLQREDQEALLAAVRRHLMPDGIFAFETRNPSGHSLATQMEEERWFTYTSVEGHNVSVSGTQVHDPLAQVLHWTTYRRWADDKGEQTKVTRIACRFTYPQELAALLHYNGFEIVQQFGGWNEDPLTAASPTVASLCRLRQA